MSSCCDRNDYRFPDPKHPGVACLMVAGRSTPSCACPGKPETVCVEIETPCEVIAGEEP